MDDASASALSPMQSALRFAIEIAALVCWAIVGWNAVDGGARWLLAIALPLVAAIVWATFRVPGDRSANGRAPVPVLGIVRLFIELDVLLGAAIFTVLVGRPAIGFVLGVAVVAHSLATHRRVRWLLAQRPTAG